jgi:hypothetical protein
MRGHLNKSEALAVLHEIYDACRESVIMTCVSLDARKVERAQTGYQIRMKCELDNPSRQCILAILEKHNLALKEEKDCLTIS